jgi:hypothetical protein
MLVQIDLASAGWDLVPIRRISIDDAVSANLPSKERKKMKLTRTKALLPRVGAPILTLLFVCVFMLALSSAARAQQTVFNVPTTDVLDRGKIYVEADISAKPNDSEALKHFTSVVPRAVVGVRSRRVEVGVNVIGNIQPGKDSTTIVPAIKVKLYGSEKNGWAVVAGGSVYVPVRQRLYKAGTYNYVQISKMLTPSTRIGAGPYFYSKNVVASNASRGGAQLSIEQSINHWLSLNADWISGKHANGYLTVGPAFKLSNRLIAVAAYSIGNDRAVDGNHFIYVELGYLLN